MFMPTNIEGSINLQSTVASASAMSDDGSPAIIPHHPITCAAGLYFDEDGVLSCDHAKTEKTNRRTQAALNHSLAILLLEFASKL